MKRIYSTLMMIAMMAVATISLNSCSVADDIGKSIDKAIDKKLLTMLSKRVKVNGMYLATT